MKTQLLKKLYAFILTAMMFYASANAQIVYTDVNPDSTSSGTYNLDLNNDGTNDFTLKRILGPNISVHCTSCISTNAMPVTISIQPLGSNAIGLDGGNSKLNSNTLIDLNSLSWTDTVSVILRKTSYSTTGVACYYNHCIPNPTQSGSWATGGTDKYLGLRINVGSESYYGWVKLTINSSTSFTVKDYALNSVANQSILAGQTCSPQASIKANGSLSFCLGGSVVLTSKNSGNTLKYQWKKNNINLNGATNKNYTATTAGDYKVKVTDTINNCCKTSGIKTVSVPCRVIDENNIESVQSEQRIETTCNCCAPNWGCLAGDFNCYMHCLQQCGHPNAPPTISTTDSLVFCSGDSVTLTANRSGATTYQWKKDSVNIPGATAKTFIATAGGIYQCRVTNSCSSQTSVGKTVVVETAPTVTLSANGSLSFCNGDSVILTANTAALHYQWKKGGVNISGATSKTYIAKSAGVYKCKVTNSCGSKTSGGKTVTVPCKISNESIVETLELISVYPNPASNSVIVKFPSDETGEISIVNLFGQIIFSEKINTEKTQIDVSRFSAGMYVVRWSSGENNETKIFSIIK